jgi:hypothetical protein
VAGTAEAMSLKNDRGRQKTAPPGGPWARVGLLLTAAAVALTACSGAPASSPSANPQHVASLGTSSAAAAASSRPASSNSGQGESSTGNSSAALQFSQCMRAHGVSDFPDPSPGGGYNFNAVSTSSPTFQAAQSACQKYFGAGTPTGQVLTQDLDHLLRYAKCMRSHSVINFPDPVLRSGLPPGFDFPPNMDLTSPAFLAADNVCHGLLPHGGEGHGP